MLRSRYSCPLLAPLASGLNLRPFSTVATGFAVAKLSSDTRNRRKDGTEWGAMDEGRRRGERGQEGRRLLPSPQALRRPQWSGRLRSVGQADSSPGLVGWFAWLLSCRCLLGASKESPRRWTSREKGDGVLEVSWRGIPRGSLEGVS